MPTIHDEQGNIIDSIPLSEKQTATLNAGEEITVIYHTPQMMRGVLGERSGAFTLHKVQERIVTQNVDQLKHYIELQQAIKAARSA